MKEMWTYDKHKRLDKNGNRWYFVRHDFIDEQIDYDERPFEIYFRNEERTIFGVLKVKKAKDNSYKDYKTMINVIMNKNEFRNKLLDPETESLWNKNWK
ncbi:hypothetical protein KAI68_04215 [bacterium]|nr:hypothetical protein [bacterium]